MQWEIWVGCPSAAYLVISAHSTLTASHHRTFQCDKQMMNAIQSGWASSTNLDPLLFGSIYLDPCWILMQKTQIQTADSGPKNVEAKLLNVRCRMCNSGS